MRVSKVLDSIFGVPKTLGLIFNGQQRNAGMDVREYPGYPAVCRQFERHV